MSLESLQNPLAVKGVLPTSVALRPIDGTTNDPTWNQDTQYFKGDWVVSPTDFGMYCYTAFDPVAVLDLPTGIKSANDPASALGYLDGWQAAQGQGALPNGSFIQTTGIVPGNAGGVAGPLVLPAGLAVVQLPYGGVGSAASTWRVTLSYSVAKGGADFNYGEVVNWTVISSGGAGPHTATSAQHNLADAASGSAVSFIVQVAAGSTTLTLTGAQTAIAAAAVLVFNTGAAIRATWERLQ
jgi:hypothetical protein